MGRLAEEQDGATTLEGTKRNREEQTRGRRAPAPRERRSLDASYFMRVWSTLSKRRVSQKHRHVTVMSPSDPVYRPLKPFLCRVAPGAPTHTHTHTHTHSHTHTDGSTSVSFDSVFFPKQSSAQLHSITLKQPGKKTGPYITVLRASQA